MILALLVLSAWPALVSQSSFPGNDAAQAISEGFR